MFDTAPFSAGNRQALSEDRDRILYRGSLHDTVGGPAGVLIVVPAAEHPAPAVLERLAKEYALRDELDPGWAARPLELKRERGRVMLVLEDPGGEPLDGLLTAPLDLRRFLHLAIAIAVALSRLHQRHIVHKDI